jgi:hypothetical protein
MFNNIAMMEVRKYPNSLDLGIELSADTFLWDIYHDVALIRKVCLSRYSQPIEGEDGYFTQLKSLAALAQLPKDAFACFIGAEDNFYEELKQGVFIPNKQVYDEISDQLVLLGYEVVLRDFQSYSVYSSDSILLTENAINKYGLIKDLELAKKIQTQISSSKDGGRQWNIVAIYTDKTSHSKLEILVSLKK